MPGTSKWLGILLFVLGASALAGAPVDVRRHRFWFELNGAPVGVVELRYFGEERAESAYEYESIHLFQRGARRQSFRKPAGTAACIPASHQLFVRPGAIGCVEVCDELTAKQGQSCVEAREGDVDRGTALGERYTARYEGGLLRELEVGAARFTRAEGVPPPPIDLFRDGLPIQAGTAPLKLADVTAAPTLVASSRTRAEVIGQAAKLRDGRECLALAKELVAYVGERSSAIAYGLVLDGGRLYPHAWVRVAPRDGAPFDLDAAMNLPVKPATHLVLAYGNTPLVAGQLYLDLWSGTKRVTRTE